MARPSPMLRLGLLMLLGLMTSTSAMTGRNDRRSSWRNTIRESNDGDNADARPPPPPPPLSSASASAVVAGAAVPIDGGASLRFDPDPSHPQALAHGAFLDARHTKSNFGKLRLVLGSAEAARQRSDKNGDGDSNGDADNKNRRRRPHARDRAEAFASGWLEGWLTAERIYDHFFNMDRYFRAQLNASVDRPMEWLRRNDAWVRGRVARAALDDEEEDGASEESEGGGGNRRGKKNSNKDDAVSDRQYWATVDLIVAQADGVAAGYAARSEDAARRARELGAAAAVAAAAGGGSKAAAAAEKAKAAEAEAAAVPPLAPDDLLFLNGNGDLYDVMDMYDAIDAGELPSSPTGRDGDGDGDGDSRTARRRRARRDRRGNPATLGPWARRKFGLPSLDDEDDEGEGGGGHSNNTTDNNNNNNTTNNPSNTDGALRLARDLELAGHCSALVKVAADLSDVYFAHSTWDSFTAMTRIYKHLDWGSVRGPAAPLGAARVSHSGYPGEVASDDDFYVASSGLLVTEATLHIFDAQALAPLVDQQGERVLSWVRVRAATALATGGEGWVSLLRREQSGTYNNAFFVVDLKQFVPASSSSAFVGEQQADEEEEPDADKENEEGAGLMKKRRRGDAPKTRGAAADGASADAPSSSSPPPLPGLYPGFLWLAEQLPGRLPARDLTPVVALGYAAAYNVPRDPKIYSAAGYPAMVRAASRLAQRDRSYEMPSRLLSYQSSPRAQLFRRDQARVVSVRDAQRLMRSNAYATDPISERFPVAAVCGRGDLIARPDLAVPKGCYDTKVTSWSLAWGTEGEPSLAAEVVGGPTLGGRLLEGSSGGGGGGGGGGGKEDPSDPADGPLPPFRWDPVLHRDFAHRGMHEGEYRFRFERQQAQEDLPLPGDRRAKGGGGGGGDEAASARAA